MSRVYQKIKSAKTVKELFNNFDAHIQYYTQDSKGIDWASNENGPIDGFTVTKKRGLYHLIMSTDERGAK